MVDERELSEGSARAMGREMSKKGMEIKREQKKLGSRWGSLRKEWEQK